MRTDLERFARRYASCSNVAAERRDVEQALSAVSSQRGIGAWVSVEVRLGQTLRLRWCGAACTADLQSCYTGSFIDPMCTTVKHMNALTSTTTPKNLSYSDLVTCLSGIVLNCRIPPHSHSHSVIDPNNVH